MAKHSILVTGVNGMIGYALTRRLTAEGRRVVGMDRIAQPEGGLPCSVILGELSDPHRLHGVICQHAVDRIVHCGGLSDPMLLRDNPYQLLETNVGGTARYRLRAEDRVRRRHRRLCRVARGKSALSRDKVGS